MGRRILNVNTKSVSSSLKLIISHFAMKRISAIEFEFFQHVIFLFSLLLYDLSPANIVTIMLTAFQTGVIITILSIFWLS